MRRAILAAGLSMCACSAESGETAIDLTIRYEPALGLDQFALTASAGGEALVERTLLPEADRPLSETGRETVIVIVPASLGGDEVTVRVEGLVRGEVAAAGQVTVRVAPGELVAAELTVRPPGEDECEAWEWQPSNVVPCDDAAPDGSLVLDQPGVYTISTETGQVATPDGDSLVPAGDLVAQAGGPMVRLVAVDELVVEADSVLEVTGPHALVVAVWGQATIAGDIEVWSGGAGAAACGPAGEGQSAGDEASGAGGGGGGGHGDDGGDGGDGRGDEKGAKGAKGTAAGDATLVPLRGGCAGGPGGDAFGSNGSGGAGGAGGGAIQIAARDSLALSGTLRAAGGGGAGGGATSSESTAGGGGGGAGGAVLLESPTIRLGGGAVICANGGSGGEGGASGEAGADGVVGTCSDERAETVNELSEGGDGGRGSAGDDRAGENGKTGGGEAGGGGGGGGGIGRVHLRALDDLIDLGALLTPPVE